MKGPETGSGFHIFNFVSSLSERQVDRYSRARRVWFNTKTKTLRFEDREV